MKTTQQQLHCLLQLRGNRWDLCTTTVATSSMSLTRRAKGCLAFRCLRTSPSLLRTQGSSSELSTCTSRQAGCLRMSAWTLTLRTRLPPSRRTPLSRGPIPPPQQPSQVIQLTHPGLSHPVRPPPDQSPLPRPLKFRLLPLQDSSSDSEEEMQGPDGQLGYHHVLKLAKALLEARSLQELSDKRVDRLITLWQRLPESDKTRVVYPLRHQEGPLKGRFKAVKGKDTSCPGKESLQRCLLGLHSGPVSLHQSPGGGYLQPALPSPPHGHVGRGDHQDSVVPYPGGLCGRQRGSAGQPENDGSDPDSAL